MTYETGTPGSRAIEPRVWYESREVMALLGHLSRRQLRRLGIPSTPMARGKALYLGQDLLDYLATRGRRAAIRRLA